MSASAAAPTPPIGPEPPPWFQRYALALQQQIAELQVRVAALESAASAASAS